MSAKAKGWKKDPYHLEFRRTLNGAECIVRPVRPVAGGLTAWSCSIHHGDRMIDVTTHDTHWDAMAHAVEVVA